MTIRMIPTTQRMKNRVQQSKYYLAKRTSDRKKCLNCGTLHNGRYCPNCGQSVEKINKPFKEFLLDILDSMAAFDFRFWNSVKLMFTKPEKLSEEYLEGKRVRYMPPFKMYFFVSFIFFFVVNWKADNGMEKNGSVILSDSTLAQNSMIEDSLNEVISVADVDKAFAFFADSTLNENDLLPDSLLSKSKINKKRLAINVKKRLKQIIQEESSKRLFFQKALKYSSWMLFLLMPIFALFLMMLHSRRKKYYVSHLVFSVNTHTLIFMILTIVLLIEFKSEGLLLLLIPFYTIRSMKKFYNQPWGKTIVKFFILTALYNFVLLAAFVLVFIISFGTF